MKLLKLLGILLAVTSCSTEKLSLSPISQSINDSKAIPVNLNTFPGTFTAKTGIEFYSAELSNQISTFPRFQNSALNAEVSKLKFNVKEYVYAVQSFNIVGQESALFNIEKSYRKIQQLRKYLSTPEDEVINRYLVRIKSNISQLESLKKDTIR